MIHTLRRTAVVVGASAALVGGVALPATAQQNGLVNVEIGDVTVIEDVAVAVAANIAANICGVTVQNVNVLAANVDQTGTTETICENGRGRASSVAITDA